MSKLLRATAIAGALLLAAAIAPALAGAQTPAVVSPEVTHTGTAPTGYTVTFRYYAPAATSVQIRGEWGLRSVNDGTTRPPSQYQPGDFFNEALVNDMVLDPATGIWSWTTPLPPGTWSYQFRPTPCTGCVGESIQDPANPTFNQVGDTTLGSYEPLSQVYVPQDPAFSPAADARPLQAPASAAEQGQLEVLRYASPGATTCTTLVLCASPEGQHDLSVYTPPGYDRNRAVPYPTLYLSHGGQGNEIDWSTQGAANEIIDNLIRTGKLQPVVVRRDRLQRLAHRRRLRRGGVRPRPHQQRDPVRRVALPRVAPARRPCLRRASAGGGRAGQVLFNYPTTFGYYGIWSSTAAFGPTVDMSHPDARTRLALHVGIGNQDPGLPRHEGLARLAATDIPFVRNDVNGVHSWDVWRQLLAIFVSKWAFRHTTTEVTASGTTVTATVRPSTTGPAVPSGSVHFFSAAGDPLGAPVTLAGGKATLSVPGRGAVITARYGGDALYNASVGSATTGTGSGSGGGSGGGRPGVDRRVGIRRTTLRVDRKRRVKVQVRCGPTRGSTCRGTLQLRAGGSRTDRAALVLRRRRPLPHRDAQGQPRRVQPPQGQSAARDDRHAHARLRRRPAPHRRTPDPDRAELIIRGERGRRPAHRRRAC